MANPTASVTVSFSSEVIGDDGSENDYVLRGEVRSEDNGGRTQFLFSGSAPIYRVYKSDNILSVRQFTTDGTVSSAGSGVEEITETVTFNNSQTTNTSYPISGGLSVTNLGGIGLGVISQSGPSQLQCSKQSDDPLDPIIGVYLVSYRSNYRKYALSNVSKPNGFGEGEFTDYPVLIHLVGITEGATSP